MITGYKSIKTIMSGLYRDLGYNTEINFGDLVEWVGEALAMIGAYSQFTDKNTCLEVCNHEVLLPCDFYRIIDINFNGKPIRWESNTLAHLYGCQGCKITDCCTEEYFYITQSHIKTSFKEGKLCIVYLAIPSDTEGYPLVPDDVYYDKALKAYCTYMLDRIEFRKQKLPEVAYRDSEKDWYFYVNSARGAANMPDTAMLESLKNVWVRMIPRTNEWKKNFVNLNNQERRRTF